MMHSVFSCPDRKVFQLICSFIGFAKRLFNPYISTSTDGNAVNTLPWPLFESKPGYNSSFLGFMHFREKNIKKRMSRVLVVDDEPDVCFIISDILRGSGFESRESHSVNECIGTLENYHPDFVILDIDLPDGSGLDVLPLIKSKYPNVKVIMNSALDTAENRARADERGAYAFLSKPLNKKKLFDVMLAN